MTATIEWEPRVWTPIKAAIGEATSMARATQKHVRFEFNGYHVEVAGDSDSDLMYRDWRRTLDGCISGTVGPYPKRILSPDDTANDERMRAEIYAEVERMESESRAQAAKATAERDAQLATAPAMSRDATAWQVAVDAQNGEICGLAVLLFAERWARLMQKAMIGGKSIAAIADDTASIADTGIGISGFMYGAAVSILAQTWVYGEELKQWHVAPRGVAPKRI